VEYLHGKYRSTLLLRLSLEARGTLEIRVRSAFRARAHATLHRAEVRVILQRLFVCSFGFGLLVGCGSGSATNPPSPTSQDPLPNINSPVQGSSQAPPGNSQTAPTPSQRPVLASGGSGGSNNSQGGSDNGDMGGRRGDTGGSANPGGCNTTNSCASCDLLNDCANSCACYNQVGGQLDCASFCM
jgi:hypothetical protein